MKPSLFLKSAAVLLTALLLGVFLCTRLRVEDGPIARVLGVYVRNLKLISLEDAIRKMTSLPARTFGFRDRGLIREAFAANLVIFDEKTIIDQATYDKPHQFPGVVAVSILRMTVMLRISLCNLCVLCVSVVSAFQVPLTTETQRTQRLHREEERALWVVRTTLTSPEKIQQLVKAAADNGDDAGCADLQGSKKRRPEVVVSAAVFANDENAYTRRFQDWRVSGGPPFESRITQIPRINVCNLWISDLVNQPEPVYKFMEKFPAILFLPIQHSSRWAVSHSVFRRHSDPTQTRPRGAYE